MRCITLEWKLYHGWTWELRVVAHHAIAVCVEFEQILMRELHHRVAFCLFSCSIGTYLCLWLWLWILILICSSLLLLTLSRSLNARLGCCSSDVCLWRGSWLCLTGRLWLCGLGLCCSRGLLSSLPLRYLLPWSTSRSSSLSCWLWPLLTSRSSIWLLRRITLRHLLHIHSMHLHCLHLRWKLEIESHRLE